jgi:uncharacterized protein
MIIKNREFQIFIKPVGASCNLSCRYCYYINNGWLSGLSSGRMDEECLERYISQHIEASPDKEIFFSWHGGEPTLAGIDFFRKVAEIQRKYRNNGYNILNGIQTNGTLVDDDWARFFSEENFYVGISIDGDEELHNRFRTYRNGKPSFGKTIEGYKRLREYGVRTEILCVVNSRNARYPLRVYRYLKSLGTLFITFLPLVEKEPGQPGMVSDISVPADDFGRFLCEVFDEWIVKDIGEIKIQIIEEALRTSFGQEHSLCVFRKHCGGVPVVEYNGDFYSCDHFVNSDHLIGNINSVPLGRLLDDERQISFGRAKEITLPGYCRICEVLAMCNGECPRNRFIKTPLGEEGLNYLCSGYRLFFNHIRPFAEAVRTEWQQGR